MNVRSGGHGPSEGPIRKTGAGAKRVETASRPPGNHVPLL
jgi:hypothetical protein